MITAIIPARSGSKRLPGKNIMMLNGKPLIFHTIDAVLGHPEITKVIFTTDSDEYINLAKAEYADKIEYVFRPAEYGGDKVKVYDELKRLVSSGQIDTDWYMQCLPTCPLRDYNVVRGMLDQWKLQNQPIFSAVEYDFPVQFAFTLLDDGQSWEPLLAESPMVTGNTRSQDIPKTYRPNGAMYLQNVKNISNKTLYQGAGVYLMPADISVDIDNEIDFLVCEYILDKRKG